MIQVQPWIPRLDEFQGPARSSPGRGTLPSLKMTSCDLQPVDSPTGSAQNRHVWPQGGNSLGAGTLKPAQHPMGRPQTSFNAQKLLVKGPGGVGSNRRTICPPCLVVCLDGLSGRLRVAREEVCQDKK